MLRRWLPPSLLLLTALLLALPVLAVLASWAQWTPEAAQILAAMAATVLPQYLGATLVLCGGVAVGVAVVGAGTAVLVTLFEFPGRRTLEWALLLPLAIPAYVVAYASTDFLQYSGPLQTWLRASFGLQGRVFPEVRSLGGAAWVFTFALYP
ncbi:MAG TPA: iron ABC transporter permease, partial [Burkholderiaceae bacterium]